MGLSRTAPTVAVGDQPDHVTHTQLLAALDEILFARFNGRSFLIFQPGAAPQPPLGDRFRFGTTWTHLYPLTTAYDLSEEFPPTPVGGQVLSYDAATKVVWVTGFSGYRTLNRKRVTWTPPGGSSGTWWLGLVDPERWEPLALADIGVENYTDPVAGVNTKFTWRSHWDRYGTIRIHNGNKFILDLEFEGGTQPREKIPPWGCITGRRPAPDQPFVFSYYYLAPTLKGDVLKWESPFPGQFAASMELAEWLCSLVAAGAVDSGYWARCVADYTDDQTELDQPYFAGHAPDGSDAMIDWLAHQGQILSVVLDKRDGTVRTKTLTWQGTASIPDASWSGEVTASIDVGTGNLKLQSAITPPVGASPPDWEHDLIPISTNALGLTPISIKSPVVMGVGHLNLGSGTHSCPLLRWPMDLNGALRVALWVHEPDTMGGGGGAAAFQWDTVYLTDSPQPGGNTWSVSLASALQIWPPGTGFSDMASGRVRSLGSMQVRQDVELVPDSGWTLPADLQGSMLWWVDTDGETPAWRRMAGFGSTGAMRHFAARIPRRYHPSGSIAGGVAVHGNHPKDTLTQGTPDGLGGALGWSQPPIRTSPIRIESLSWTQSDTAHGRDVFLPADALHYVLQHVQTTGWWKLNRAAIMAGSVPEDAKLLTWRIARQAAQFNACSLVVNSVREIRPVTVLDLNSHALPSGCHVYPFTYEGEAPFAVPYGWRAGRYDDDHRLADWCSYWGISSATDPLPDMITLRAKVRQVWAQLRERRWYHDDVTFPGETPSDPLYYDLSHGEIIPLTWKWVKRNYSAFTGSITSTVNGETYDNLSAWDPDVQRHLFGGAGTDDGYLYVVDSDIQAVFSDLGVASPPALVGEAYSPRFADSTTCTVISGSPLGTLEDEALNPVPHALVAESVRDCASGTPSWTRVIPDLVPFRLSDPYGLQGRHLYSTEIDGSVVWPSGSRTTQDIAWAVNWSASDLKLIPHSSRQSLPQPFSGASEPSWPDVAHIYCEVPCLISGTPEPRFHQVWNDSTEIPDVVTVTPDAYEMHMAEAPAGTVVDCAWLQAHGWPDSPAYHLQILRRTGELRV